MQNPLIVEDHDLAVGEPKLELIARIAQQPCETAIGGVERRGGIVQRDGLAVIPELPVAEVTVPLDIKSAGSLQGDVLDRGVLQLLPSTSFRPR